MAKIAKDGRVEMNEIELEDAELDRIDYSNFSTYKRYLEEVNEVTVNDVMRGLKKMGLFIE